MLLLYFAVISFLFACVVFCLLRLLRFRVRFLFDPPTCESKAACKFSGSEKKSSKTMSYSAGVGCIQRRIKRMLYADGF